MNTSMQLRCEQLVENKDRVRSVFAWDTELIHLACAGIYTSKGRRVDEELLKSCKDLIKHKVGAFSNFKSTARTPIAAMLAVSENPERTLDNGLAVYQMLKKEFFSSAYLPITAIIIAQMAEPSSYEAIAAKTRAIYDEMKAKHPFLTSSEDSAFSAMLALSDKTSVELIEDAENCYHILKKEFFSPNAVQTLSHVLALCDGTADEKCRKTMELFTKLKAAGYKYGTEYELSTLGVLAMGVTSVEETIQDIIAIDEWLSKQKGFGIFSGISRKQRLMYAGILAQQEYVNGDALQTAAVSGVVSLVVAQEAAMCAVIAASTAAAAGSSSNS